MINNPSFPQARRLRFSVDEYYQLIELGIQDKHASVVNKLSRLFIKNISDEIVVRIQNPLRLSDFNEPEPDLVLADLTKYDGKRHPRPAEVILLIEVSDSTLKYDRDIKIPLYAEAEISEVWIINLPNNIIEIHQKPSNGLYQLVKIFKADEIITSESLPDFSVPAVNILG